MDQNLQLTMPSLHCGWHSHGIWKHPSLMRDFRETHICTKEGHPHKISKHSKRTGSSHVGNIVNKQEWLRQLPQTCRRLSGILLPIAVGTEGRGKQKWSLVGGCPAMAVNCLGIAAHAPSGFWRQGSEKETQLQQSGLDPANQDGRIPL